MVTLSQDVVEESISLFIKELKRHHDVQEIFLFGSHLTGHAHQWSDIDLLVISSDFGPDRHSDRLSLIRIARNIDDRIEPHQMAPDDFNVSNPLAYEVQRTGVRISLRDSEEKG